MKIYSDDSSQFKYEKPDSWFLGQPNYYFFIMQATMIYNTFFVFFKEQHKNDAFYK